LTKIESENSKRNKLEKSVMSFSRRKQFKPIISFESIHPLPIIEERLKQSFMNRFVLVKYGVGETYALGKLVDFQIVQNSIILILENAEQRLVVLNPSFMKVV
jgi:hypothetical protein